MPKCLSLAQTPNAIRAKKVIEKGTGRGANIGREAAGKTGTTDDYRDAWFIGYTPEVVTGVWIGNDDNSKLGGAITGGSIPARIWNQYMRVVTAGTAPTKFDYPEIKVRDNYEAKDVDANEQVISEEVKEEMKDVKKVETEPVQLQTTGTSAPTPPVQKPEPPVAPPLPFVNNN